MLKTITQNTHTTLANTVDGSEFLVLTKLAREHNTPLIYVALDDVHMERAIESLAFFAPDIETLPFPAWDCIPYDRVSPNVLITSERIDTLSKLIAPKNPTIVVTSINAAIGRCMPRDTLKDAVMNIAVGNAINHDDFSRFLIKHGYIHTATVNESGEFCIRGNIIDICPSGSNVGYRLDFFGDDLESIRNFDLLTQISLGSTVDKLTLAPASEVVLNENTIEHFRDKYRELFGTVSSNDPLYESVSEARKYAGQEHWLPLFYPHVDTIFDYCDSPLVVLDHLTDTAFEEREKFIRDSFETREHALAHTSKDDVAYKPIPPELLYINEKEWNAKIRELTTVSLHPYALPEDDNTIDIAHHKIPNFFVESNKQQMTAFDMMKDAIKPQIVKGKGKKKVKPLITCMSEGSRTRMQNILDEYDIPHAEIDDWNEQHNAIRSGTVGLAVLKIDSGFDVDGLMVISEQDLLGEKIFRKRAGKKRRAEKFLSEAANLSEGELIIHKEHGIGRFEGLETLTVSDKSHDFILLIYHGEDKLYLPVENIDLITRYGGSAETTQLDKLGAASWQKRTANAKKNIMIAAEELIAIAAKRALRKAPAFSATGGPYDEFSSRFPYTETEDQLTAIEDVVEDLASGRPMDRLICGDVGFGKTEVAMRAAFIVAHPAELCEDPKAKGQVAIIAPTTLLCRQHYNDFVKRFAGLPVVVRQISRMSTAKEVRETKELLAAGLVDIVIGTHALLAKDIEFDRLSLLIIDEEQRFGVAQKERLKKLRGNTHVLTMTATPIPRTLQLSMSGIRDLSLITTAPVDRLAVRTFVMPYDTVVIRDSILREHYRGGRTFYVCPRVKDVEELEPKLKELIPEVKIVIAHGRMTPEELDEIMTAFYEGVYDVLLATTIVESGLDVPMANNLIIHRADMFGLGQLYQIRGRVGRSNVRAYAYLTIPPKRMPTKDALKRLEVMQKLDTLGAGFTLASHDMDIRGFGNLLGDEQSGNIKEVGVELYQTMLREAVDALKSAADKDAESVQTFSPKITIGSSVLIPADYVPNIELRMGIYRRIGNLEEVNDIEQMEIELVDRFGALPDEVKNLLYIVKIKRLCRLANIEKFDAGPKGAVLTFHKNTFASPDKLITYMSNNANKTKLRGDHKFVLTNRKWENIDIRMFEIRQALNDLIALLEESSLAA